jgi:Cd(II)/Pb(II)-responsive transcriptional regulator
MRIGELARRAGSQPETVRYYERMGLLPQPERSQGNYRLYDEQCLERLQFIRNCRAMGIPLDEIRRLLYFRDRPELVCDEVNRLLDMHIARLRVQISNLQGLEHHLCALRDCCDTPRTAGDCGILAGLETIGTPNLDSSALPADSLA